MNRSKDTLSGKTVAFLGSSVTFGSASGGVSFVEYIAQNTGATTVKEAVPGTTLADTDEQSYVRRIARIKDRPDAFVCQLSTNDAGKGVPLGRI
ncbi:MAG: SGNH/GDSL hydrolase family protein, partial [Clostridia bacterium]|nr:SGNH/GDSL hydrolase family protein [Clostridia bacterium]